LDASFVAHLPDVTRLSDQPGYCDKADSDMAEDDRRISLAGKVLVDTIDAQLLEVHKQAQVVGFGVALTMDGRFHRRNERSTTTYLLYSDDIARLISELLDATTDADPAWRDQVLGLIRLALDLKHREQ
jgi:hypothetical protein